MLGVVCFCIIIVGIVGTVQADDRLYREDWAKSANKISNWILQGQLVAAKEELAKLAAQFSEADFSNKNMDVEGIRTLSETILELEQELNRLIPNRAKLQGAATKLTLAFDAAAHSYQPLWKQYYHSINQPLLKAKQAIQEDNHVAYQQQIRLLIGNYELIRPALVVGRSDQTVQKLDSLFAALKKAESPKVVQSVFNELEKILQPLFFGSDKDVMAAIAPFGSLPFYWMMFWISSFILTVLTYVAWRKYQAEERIVQTSKI
jgi:sporulation protein YpjB